VSEIEDDDALRYCFYVVFSNASKTNLGRRPLSISLKNNAPRCLEIMIELLSMDSSQDYMKYIKHYLQQYLYLRSRVF